MVLLSILLAPMVMVAASFVERRVGSAGAGWVAALPVAFALAVLAVTVDTGSGSAASMSWSAATHVGAQVVFAVVFAHVLSRCGLLAGAVAAAGTYVACSAVIAELPDVVAVGAAAVLLVAGPRLLPRVQVTAKPRSTRWSTALTCAAAALIVAAAVVVSRAVGAELAGAVAAFPTMCLTLTAACVARAGRAAGVHTLTGLVRSLPCYMTFCATAALVAPRIGPAAIGVALLAGLLVATITWRGVGLARPALAP